MKIAGTTRVGDTNKASPATLSAEKPKPENPLTTPASPTMNRLINSRPGGKGGVSTEVFREIVAGPQRR